MTVNTSATGGPLAAAPLADPANGQSLWRFLQAWFAGVAGFSDTSLFRPRWQPEPPNLPDGLWAAFGVTSRKAEFSPSTSHDPAVSDGVDRLTRHEELEILVSFYGPTADETAEAFREGLQVSQNREVLLLNGMGLVATGDIITVPSLVKERWLYRADITVTLRRAITREFKVLSLLEAKLIIKAASPASVYTQDINVVPQ